MFRETHSFHSFDGAVRQSAEGTGHLKVQMRTSSIHRAASFSSSCLCDSLASTSRLATRNKKRCRVTGNLSAAARKAVGRAGGSLLLVSKFTKTFYFACSLLFRPPRFLLFFANLCYNPSQTKSLLLGRSGGDVKQVSTQINHIEDGGCKLGKS